MINPREVAATALNEITNDESYNNMTLKRILKQNGAMPSNDRAFVTEIVNGTLRNLFFIDYCLDYISTVKTGSMKPWILAVLRTGFYQIEFMSKVPDSAACNEAVELVKEKGFGKLTGFVNGVLRNAIRQKGQIPMPDEQKEPVKYLQMKYSHPEWLLRMWLHQYSYDFVKALCEKNNSTPDVTIGCNILKTNVNELKFELEKKGVCVKNGLMYKNALHISKTSDMMKLDCFQKGHFYIQDESSMLAVTILDPQEGEHILDVCAAPGGKSIAIAEKMNNRGSIVSRDIYDHKLELIKENTERMGITIIETENKNASEYDCESNMKFDRVLVDAPCSGLGLIRKKPDIKLKKNGDTIDSLEKIQKKILAVSSEYVKENGVLVYSTCTICKKENIKNLEWFLKNYPFEICDISEYLPENINCDTASKGYIQLYPHIHNTDGFFIASMRRKEQ